jgi:hypothetical protein
MKLPCTLRKKREIQEKVFGSSKPRESPSCMAKKRVVVGLGVQAGVMIHESIDDPH